MIKIRNARHIIPFAHIAEISPSGGNAESPDDGRNTPVKYLLIRNLTQTGGNNSLQPRPKNLLGKMSSSKLLVWGGTWLPMEYCTSWHCCLGIPGHVRPEGQRSGMPFRLMLDYCLYWALMCPSKNKWLHICSHL